MAPRHRNTCAASSDLGTHSPASSQSCRSAALMSRREKPGGLTAARFPDLMIFRSCSCDTPVAADASATLHDSFALSRAGVPSSCVIQRLCASG